MNIFICIVLATLPFVTGLIMFARWKLFGKRAAKSLYKTYQDEHLAQYISLGEFEYVMNKIGKCYSVFPEKLQLDDSFSKELSKLDSWSLGTGNECVSKFINENYAGIKIERVTTIRDLIVAIAETRVQ